MHIMNRFGRKSAFGAIGVLAALGVGGTAYAATASTATNPTTAAVLAGTNTGTGTATNPQGHQGKHPRSLLQRTDHATAEVKSKGQWVTYTIDRGKVTAVSATSITLARPDGQNVTDSISASTKFSGVSSATDVQIGKPARVISTNGAAIRIQQGNRPAAGANPTSGTNPSAPASPVS